MYKMPRAASLRKVALKQYSVCVSLKRGRAILSDGVMKKLIKISFDDYSISTSCEKYVGML